MHRLFIALRLTAELRGACLAAMDDGPPGWAWQDDDQLHVTLRYIGEVERPLAEDIAAALASLSAPAVLVALAGVGWFDQGVRGALFARVAPRDPLATLHAKLDRILIRVGLPPEGRAFLPHITLARRRPGAVDPAEWLERRAALASPPSSIDHITLFESELGRAGPAYHAIARFPLDRPYPA